MAMIGGPAATCIRARESAQGGLMTLRDVAARLKVSRRALLRVRQNDPSFPRPVDFGYTRAVIFRAQDVHDWIRASTRSP